jgi:hypothetical protein
MVDRLTRSFGGVSGDETGAHGMPEDAPEEPARQQQIDYC